MSQSFRSTSRTGTRLPAGGSGVTGGRPDVDIGVIYTHERAFMPRLLSSLRESGGGLKMRLILVDNASRDGVEPWANYFARTRLLHNRKRLRYSPNLNRILQASEADYVLLLNTDMYFEPKQQCVAKMVGFMRARPDCGIAGCRLHHADGQHAPSARRFLSPATVIARRCGLGRWMRGTLDHYLYREHPMDDSWECDWLSGCFLMIRREAFQQVGPFDVGFPKYFEDVDMCLRIARAGWRVLYYGGTYCYHLEQRASRRLFSLDAWRHVRSYLRWLRKWGFSPDRAAVPVEPKRRRAA